jgi:cell division septal protein FtsQ
MQIWPFNRKLKSRGAVQSKKILPGVAERLQNKRQMTPLAKFLARFRKEPTSKQVRFGEDFRRQRSRQQQQQVLRKFTGPVWSRVKLGVGLTTVIIAGVVIFVGVILFLLHDNQVYVIKEIEITGTKQISQDAILSDVGYLKGKSMFSFSEAGLEEELMRKFPYIKLVQIRKNLPSKVTVEIEERFPVIAYINMSGVFLVDEERIIVNRLAVKDQLTFTVDEGLVVNGFGDPNANYVYEYYLSKIAAEEERKAVKWEEVSLEDKKRALDDFKDSLQVRVSSALNNNITALLGSEFTQLPRIMGYDSLVYDIGSDFPSFKFDASQNIKRYLDKEGLLFIDMTWPSDFTLIVKLVNNIELWFSSTRSIDDQLLALATIREQADLTNVSVIDLRSELVSVR